MAIELDATKQNKQGVGRQAGPLLSRLTTPRVTYRERHLFTEQLALLLSTGMNLHAALGAMYGQHKHAGIKLLIEDLAEQIASGSQLSDALAKHPDVFSQTYINLVGAAEQGGYLPEVLEQLLEMDEKREQLRRALFSALSYPAFLVVFSIAVVVFVLVVVFPKFAGMFASIADQLPASTVFLMGASEILSGHWASLTLGLALLIVLARYLASTPAGRLKLDAAKLQLPMFSGVFTRLYLLQSLRVMSLSLNNGISVVDALRATRNVVDNSHFRRFIDGVEQRVQEGEGIGKGFEGSSFVPPMVVQMVKTGEESGNLPKVMGRLADHYERELSGRLEAVSRLAEPVMLLVMGVVVGLLVSSLILPIFKLSRAVG